MRSSRFVRGAACAVVAMIAAPAFAPRASAQSCGVGEWVCHTSADGLHPDGVEQAFVWLMNRARQDPAAEGAFLAAIDDPFVLEAIEFYGVDLDVMQGEFDAIAARPPAAFDRRLYNAALLHAALMIDENSQDPACGETGEPPCQLDRVGPAGFFFPASGLRGNSLGFAQSPIHGHAAWNIDWGPFVPPVPPGMQEGRPHRHGVMSDPDAVALLDLTNVGIAAVPTDGIDTDLGPLVTVANYANANTAVGDHYDRFVVGTVWEDLDGDTFYDPGEGIGGVVVSTDTANWFAVTSPGGGYAIPLLDPGPLQVTFSGGGLPTRVVDVTVGTTSVLVDYEVPEPGALASGAIAALALFALRSRLRTN
jgi:hypothetical protein